MILVEKLQQDLIAAMKEKNKDALNTLRSVKGAMQLEVINNKRENNDELALDIITKQIKMRNDSIIEFKNANRMDLADSYQREIDILKKYLPNSLTEEELDQIISEAFQIVNPTSIKDLGTIMKEITPKVKNRCDMKMLNEKIRQRLNN